MQNDKIIIDNDICIKCKWFFGSTSCMAFPNGIPDEIMHGENLHTDVINGQNGDFVFTKLS